MIPESTTSSATIEVIVTYILSNLVKVESYPPSTVKTSGNYYRASMPEFSGKQLSYWFAGWNIKQGNHTRCGPNTQFSWPVNLVDLRVVMLRRSPYNVVVSCL